MDEDINNTFCDFIEEKIQIKRKIQSTSDFVGGNL